MIKVEATKDYKFLSKMERDITVELKKRLEQVLSDYSVIKGEGGSDRPVSSWSNKS